jgi:alanine-glyoxylate transaminase/serine-glyoxylate transaminase/serine-pyruvate transaminase
MGERARARIERRASPPPSWYFDLSLILGYWHGAGGRVYHHTAPINMIYGLDAALARVLSEGLEERYRRHRRAHEALRSALSTLGFDRLAADAEALPSLLCVRVPGTVGDEAAARSALLAEHGVEISAGLGPLAGQAWRFGVMGDGADHEAQRRAVTAVADVIGADAGDARAALDEGWADAI